jgi:hypothetical protein
MQQINASSRLWEYRLNLTKIELLSREVFGRSLVSTFTDCRAFGGRKERKSRAHFDRGENGLKTVDTSVRNRVIMVACKYVA